jgi:hypothetical protein
MKAYYLDIAGDDDAGQAVVFAKTGREAKKQVWAHDNLVDSMENDWIRLRVLRAKRYDGMENLSPAQLALEQWKEGWCWFDIDYPDPDEASDEEFIGWYEGAFPA